VKPAALTRIWTFPKALSALAITLRTASMSARSHSTKTPSQPTLVSSLATARPRALLRPQTSTPAAPRAANRRAAASPSPCVPPVTTANLPANCLRRFLVLLMDHLSHDGVTGRREGAGQVGMAD